MEFAVLHNCMVGCFTEDATKLHMEGQNRVLVLVCAIMVQSTASSIVCLNWKKNAGNIKS